jgi:crossover junction endodeoxyribonuclease RuvC
MTTRIIGIDPGYDRLGIAIIEKAKKGREIVLHSECFQTSARDDIYTRFGQVAVRVGNILETYKPSALAIETLFITKNQKTAMRVAEVRGIILVEAIKRAISIHEYTPMQIKMAVTSDGRSDKERVIKMVHLLVSLPAKKVIDDEYDAIAVALTHSACLR